MEFERLVRARLEAVQPRLEWKPGSAEEMAAWQNELRRELERLLGFDTTPAHSLTATITARAERPGYTEETVELSGPEGPEILGYLLTPQNLPAPRPGILCLPGHGRGVDSIIGIAEDGSRRPPDAPGEYQADFALQCVQHGYPTLAIEQLSFGHRRRAGREYDGPTGASCGPDSMAALMLGETMTGWRVRDAMRALDYLQTRQEVESLVTMGISGGGLTSLFTACLDTRVSCAVVSGYFNTFRSSILTVDHCVDNYVPGLLRTIEMPDLAGLIAPRALFVESGTEDRIFPIGAFRKAVSRAAEIYKAFGASSRFGWEEFPGDHQFHGRGIFEFLARAE